MTLKDSPIRLLFKSYANGILNRQQYLEIRKELLFKLEHQGKVEHEDLANFLKLYQEKTEQPDLKKYSHSDWAIIVLGILAASALGYMLYN